MTWWKLVIGLLWSSPWLILNWAIYILPLWALRQFRFSHCEGGAAIFAVVPTWRWLDRLWKNWAGYGCPGAVLAKPKLGYVDEHGKMRSFYFAPELLDHELRHVRQCYALGPFFPLNYALLLLGFRTHKNHPLERDAEASE